MSLAESNVDLRAALPRNPVEMAEVTLDEAHSPLKVMAHEQLIRKFVEGDEFNPIHMRIGITGGCNMRCHFCNFHSDNENEFYDLFSYKDMIPTPEAIQLLTDFARAGGRAVTFCGSGECTIHPGYAEICDAAHGAGLKIGLITNGSRLDRQPIAECIGRTHTWVRIGMNAGEDETFAHITRSKPGDLTAILNSIRRLRESAENTEFRIGLNYVITAENSSEIEIAARKAKESGAHYVRFEPEFYSAMGHETIADRMPEVVSSLRIISGLSSETFEVSVPKLDRGPMDRTEEVEGDFDRCHYSRFVTAVGADGHLYPCPQVHLNSRYRIGNVRTDTYEGVLHNGPRHEWEATNPNRTDLCKSCFYRPQNELLQKLKDGRLPQDAAITRYQLEVPKTLHADFV